MPDRFNAGVELFNSGRYFDAHEIWEDEWREESGPERLWLQGLVQAAVALHHLSTGNRVGAASVISKAIANLETCPSILRGIDIACFRSDLARALSDIAATRPLAPFRIVRSKP